MSPEFIDLLSLIIIANATPVLLRFVFGHRMRAAIDAGVTLADGHRLFGASKTWRGLFGAMLFTSMAAWQLGYALWIGTVAALAALAGDLLSSFIKRRAGLKPGSMAPLLDQVPESLLPALILMKHFSLSLADIAILTLTFIIAELMLSLMFFLLGVRKSPY